MTESENKSKDRLVIVWSSENPELATTMVFMYAINSKLKGWWKEVTLIIWGPSAKLITDPEIQNYIKQMKESGIKLEACKACSDYFKVSKKLAEFGVDVKYIGEHLTKYLKEDYKVITF